MIFIDSGYIVGLVSVRDGLHARAVAWARAVAEPVVTTEYVVIEALNLLSAPAFRRSAHLIVDGLQQDPAVTVVAGDGGLYRRGLALHRDRADKHWSLTDCISFVVMHDLGVTRALAYDRHFMQAGFEALLRRDP